MRYVAASRGSPSRRSATRPLPSVAPLPTSTHVSPLRTAAVTATPVAGRPSAVSRMWVLSVMGGSRKVRSPGVRPAACSLQPRSWSSPGCRLLAACFVPFSASIYPQQSAQSRLRDRGLLAGGGEEFLVGFVLEPGVTEFEELLGIAPGSRGAGPVAEAGLKGASA